MNWAFVAGWMMALCTMLTCAMAYGWPSVVVRQVGVLTFSSVAFVVARAIYEALVAEQQQVHKIREVSAKLSEPAGDALQLFADVNALAMRAERWADEHGISSAQIDAAIAAQRAKTYLQHAARMLQDCAEMSRAARKAS